MRLSELVLEVQTALDSTTARKWSATQIVAALNVQQRSMVRTMADQDEDYFNHRFVLAKTAARVPHQGIQSWRMPQWIMKISSIRPYYGGSSYSRGEPIPRLNNKYSTCGWRSTASNELSLIGFNSSLDLEVACAKLPARMTQGTLPSSASSTQLQLELSPTYPVETQVDAYAGALFEITGPASTRVGQVLRATASTSPTGTAGPLLTMEEAWAVTPLPSDTYEMHAEVPTQHCRLLVLLAARVLLSQEKNMDGLNVIAAEMNEQWRQFIDSMVYRDLGEPHTVTDKVPTASVYQHENPYLEEYR